MHGGPPALRVTTGFTLQASNKICPSVTRDTGSLKKQNLLAIEMYAPELETCILTCGNSINSFILKQICDRNQSVGQLDQLSVSLLSCTDFAYQQINPRFNNFKLLNSQ